VIVDDNPLILAILNDMISEHPDLRLVGEFQNSEEAISELPKTKPDILFLDFMMPGLDGLDVLDVLEVFDFKPSVIVVSGKRNLKEGLLEHPMVLDFLDKPIDIIKFNQAIQKSILSHSQL